MKRSTPALDPWQNYEQKPYIVLENVSKSFDGVTAIAHIHLCIYQKEFFSILGGSGCGKTTVLRMLAGFETPDTGKIFIDGIDVTRMPPYERPVNMMFQSYALFPHMNVMDNVAFGLRQEKLAPSVIRERVSDMLHLVHMHEYGKRMPHELSGGQKQRVGLARALAKLPKVLLLDEPLAALDKRLREHTQFELVNIQEQVGITFVMVTHDQEEAMTMSSRLAIMRQGAIAQVGTPSEIYEHPASKYVAEFIGLVNIFTGIVHSQVKGILRLTCHELDEDIYVTHGAGVSVGSKLLVAVRPEKIMMSVKKPPRSAHSAKGIVRDIAYLGDLSIYYIQTESGKKIVVTQPNLVRLSKRKVTWDDEVYVFWKPENGVILGREGVLDV